MPFNIMSLNSKAHKHFLHDLWTDKRNRVGGKVRGWVQLCTCLMGTQKPFELKCMSIGLQVVIHLLFYHKVV